MAATPAPAAAVKMDEEEIDMWYEEEKQKCMDDYLKEIESGNHDDAEKKYNERLGKLIAKYNSMMTDAIQGKKSPFKDMVSGIKKTVFRK